MKFLLAFLLMTAAAHAQPKLKAGELYARRGQLVPPPELFTQEELNKVFFSESRQYQEELKKVKYYLINGELSLAKVFLEKLTFGQSKLKPVAHRYLGLIAFIEQDYKKSIDYLTRGELQNPPHFAKICGVLVLDKIVLSDLKTLEADWDRCRVEAQRDVNAVNLPWLDTLVKLKLSPVPGITSAPFKKITLRSFENVDLKIILKLALYLNQENLVVNQLFELTPEQLVDTDVRELAGHIFFRSGKFANAYKFIEDIKSPNSENIKGNLYLLREKYEIAYAQFKLALKEKQNSQNALERLVPIAWLLGDWKGGSEYARQLIARSNQEANKLTIIAAFEMQMGNYKKASSILNEISRQSRRGASLEVAQIASFSALMENDGAELKAATTLSCEQNDLVNCWVLYQHYHWDNFPLVVRRDNDITFKEEWQTLTKEKLPGKLTEQVYVYQQDIEELDDKMIKLIK
ncbi:MAG: tetratricopeptide repeat protein [Bacteriovoracaceae bacterium]